MPKNFLSFFHFFCFCMPLFYFFGKHNNAEILVKLREQTTTTTATTTAAAVVKSKNIKNFKASPPYTLLVQQQLLLNCRITEVVGAVVY